MGIISVKMPRHTLRITKSASTTVIDMISNIGGTLGLFMGCSLISGMEILYWVLSYLGQKMVKLGFGSNTTK